MNVREEGYWVLRDERYEALVGNMWKGKYLEAIRNGELLLSEIKKIK